MTGPQIHIPPLAAYLRLLASLAGLAVGIAAAVLIVQLIRTTPGPTASAISGGDAGAKAPPVRSTTSSFPAPPPAAVVFAREAGTDAVGLAISRARGGIRLQASVVGQTGSPRDDLAVRFIAGPGRRALVAQRCGRGCYAVIVDKLPRSVDVELRAGAVRRVAFALPAAWPPRSGAELVDRAERVWRNLRTLVTHERLASSPTLVLNSVLTAVAPDRLSYLSSNGSQSIIVGARRWDRTSSQARWERSPQDPKIRQPVPFWGRSSNEHVVGSAVVRGRDTWRVTFFDRESSAWFEAFIDKRNYRTLELRMTAAAHFMHDVYGPFDAPVEVEPPR
jgi:hypothetical protein